MPDGSPLPQADPLDLLRQGTDGRHRAVEALPRLVRLTAPDLDRAAYGDVLLRFRAHHARTEAAMITALAPAVPARDLALRRRLPALDRDLADLGLVPGPVDEAGDWPDPPRSVAAAAGWLYVNEGATLGGLVLRRHVRAALPDAPIRYLSGHGRATAPTWAATRRIVARCLTGPSDVDEAVAAACAAFDAIARAMR